MLPASLPCGVARRGGDVDDHGAEPLNAQRSCRFRGIAERSRAIGRAVARDVAAPVGEKHQQRLAAAAPHLVGDEGSLIDGRTEGRSTAAGKIGEAAAGALQRASRRQKHFGLAAAEGDEGDAVTPDVAVGKDQLDGALGFRHALQGGRTRCVDHEDRRGLVALLVAVDAEVLALAPVCRCGPAPASA